jgi:hypothetical protein
MPDADNATCCLPGHMVLLQAVDLGMHISWVSERTTPDK